MSHYQTLGVARDATPEQIKQAFRRLAMQHHPDRNNGDEEKMKEIQVAYAVLSDPEKRARYDRGEDVNVTMTKEQILEAKAVNLLVQLFEQIIQGMDMNTARVVDPFKSMRKSINDSARQLKPARGRLWAELKKCRQIKRRMSGGSFYLYDHLRQRRLLTLQKIKELRDQQHVFRKALEGLEEMKYQTDPNSGGAQWMAQGAFQTFTG